MFEKSKALFELKKIQSALAKEVIEVEAGKLPGVGPRTAERLAFHVLKGEPGKASTLAAALANLHAGVRTCQICYNFAEADTCAICAAASREAATIAVVEEPFDVVAIEK